ncbi:rab GTPase-binding effector protein 1 [Caerostris darwini]|uniref:Rab GTPase-binding effector protein 1 n=1 Tax=Caerostris darwini TaxID=1538125 RepID=A0AAV4W1Z7_9ARAC|nr:rab GTPase-binding effector protein 1 [Caerostris darwini]
MNKFNVERDVLKRELENVQNENDGLLGKHIVKAQQMRNEDINLLDTTEELQFYCLQKQEEFVTIKAAERKLQHFNKIVKEQILQDFISSQGVTWKFIIEHAPWWGGFYERLMKCVKDPSWKNSRTWKIRDIVLIHGTHKSKLL